jgi:hypothetical protein
MVALGTMNIIGSMTSCYVATGNNWFNRKQFIVHTDVPFFSDRSFFL